MAWLISVLMNTLEVACSYSFELNEFTEAAINLSRESPDEENRLVVSEAAVISFVEFMLMAQVIAYLSALSKDSWS